MLSHFVGLRRDGKAVWPYCSECGCRLQIHPASDLGAGGKWHLLNHFGSFGDRDARGCKCYMVSVSTLIEASKVAEFA
jgi:hypothetical protein